MKRFYSQSAGTCYIDGIHSDIPSDAVLIDDERYNEVIANPDPSKVRDHDVQGLPVLIDPPAAVLTADELASIERAWRDAEVSFSEWLVTRHRDEQDMQLPTTLTTEQFIELLVYRQTLRDWPQTEAFPDSAQRPIAPPWIADQSQ